MNQLVGALEHVQYFSTYSTNFIIPTDDASYFSIFFRGVARNYQPVNRYDVRIPMGSRDVTVCRGSPRLSATFAMMSMGLDPRAWESLVLQSFEGMGCDDMYIYIQIDRYYIYI